MLCRWDGGWRDKGDGEIRRREEGWRRGGAGEGSGCIVGVRGGGEMG